MKEDSQNWDLVVTPHRNLLDLKLWDVWRYRYLMLLIVRRDIVSYYKQTILGPVWYFISPIVSTIVFIFVFGKLAGLSTDGISPTLFYMSGTIAWSYFSSVLTSTSNVFITNASIFGKVYFPRLIMPLGLVISNLFKFVIQLAMLIIVMIYLLIKGEPIMITWYILLFPLMLILLAAQGLGLGMIVSATTTKYRDVAMMLGAVISLLMYSTTVVYPLSALNGKLFTLVALNPITPVIEGIRKSLFGIGTFNIYFLLYAIGISILILFIGTMIFNKAEKNFVDTV